MSRPVVGIGMNYMVLGQYHQYHIRDKYIDAVHEHGGLPLPIPCLGEEGALRQFAAMVDAMIFIGGMDYPPEMYGETPHPETEPMEARRAKSDALLAELLFASGKPVLGICAGMQLLNICRGGKLVQHLSTVANHLGEKYHSITIEGSRWLKQIFPEGRIVVNSNHHQAIDPLCPGKGFKVVARADDGVIEAIESEGKNMVLGIQWHPERISDAEHRRRLFEFFLSRAEESRHSRKKAKPKNFN